METHIETKFSAVSPFSPAHISLLGAKVVVVPDKFSPIHQLIARGHRFDTEADILRLQL
jgi:hypothetical protein